MKKTLLSVGLALSAATLGAVEGSPILKVSQGARAAALGGATSMLAGSAEGLWVNPASIAGLGGAEVGFSHSAWIGETSQEYLSAAWGGERLGLGAFAQYSAAQDLARDSSGQALGSFGVQAMNVGLAAGWKAGALRLGLQAKALEQGTAGQQGQGWVGDAGLQASAYQGRLLFGAALQNLGSQSDPGAGNAAVRPPLTLRGGLGLNLPLGLSALAEGRHYGESGQNALGAGLEYRRPIGGVRSAARLGWESGLADGGPSGMSAGLGLGLGAYQVDYAFQSMGELCLVHRLSLTWSLGTPATPAPRDGRHDRSAQALAAYNAGRYREAAERYQGLAGSDDAVESSKMLSSSAMAWYKAGDKAKALAAFKAALAKTPARPRLQAWVDTLEKGQ